MHLAFRGATGTVTGSCFQLDADGKRFLVDCGLFQGRDESWNEKLFAFDPAQLDGVILTHAHIDHSGRLPLLRKQGFTGPIYTHPATADLAGIMLLDSAHIMESETERYNRKARRAGRPLRQPMYSLEDAVAAAEQMVPVAYGEWLQLTENLRVRLHDAGHILGSAFLELEHHHQSQTKRVVMSGDLGQPDRKILRDPAPIPREVDYLVLESTYGDRHHEPTHSTREALADIIRSTVYKGGNVVIPAFAVGRTQEILYQLNILVNEHKLPADLKVVLDSPLAIAATEVTQKHQSIFDQEALRMARNGDDPFDFPGLIVTRTAEESRALNDAVDPMVIIAASGMCDAGRVQHHLKHNLWRPVSTVLFVGFQAEGSLGRRILDGAKRVRLFGEEMAVRARIESLPGLSAHADQTQLLGWVGGLKRPPCQTFLVHGEEEAREELARRLQEKGHRVRLPVMDEMVDLGVKGARKVETQVYRPAQPRPDKYLAALERELRQIQETWRSNNASVPPHKADELGRRVDEALSALQAIRNLLVER